MQFTQQQKRGPSCTHDLKSTAPVRSVFFFDLLVLVVHTEEVLAQRSRVRPRNPTRQCLFFLVTTPLEAHAGNPPLCTPCPRAAVRAAFGSICPLFLLWWSKPACVTAYTQTRIHAWTPQTLHVTMALQLLLLQLPAMGFALRKQRRTQRRTRGMHAASAADVAPLARSSRSDDDDVHGPTLRV